MKIGDYTVRGLLGRGGMGAVYKVQKNGGPLLALKLLDPAEMFVAIVGMREAENRFLAEARALSSLRHSHIVSIHDQGRDQQGRPFFTMDYSCQNLGDLIGETYMVEDPSRVLPVERAVALLQQVLSALGALHGRGIIHRDIKPFNVLLTAQGQVKLIDFGLSRLRGERILLHRSEKVGSPYYSAPEQEQDPAAAGPAADLYSCAVMLYRMLSGQLPQERLLSSLRPELSACWDDFFHTALAPAPASRFASAVEMSTALSSCFSSWEQGIEQACVLPEGARANSLRAGRSPRFAPWPGPLRSSPVRTGPRRRPEQLGLDPLWRPQIFCSHDFLQEGTLLHDRTLRLVWDRVGSPEPMDFPAAIAYVQALNSAAHHGIQTWRLPTLPELLSLLEPVRQGQELCQPRQFASSHPRLWCADRRTHLAAWFANMELGFLGYSDLSCQHWVCAVSSA